MSAGQELWCGAAAPPVQGLLVGFGALSVGLVLFPYTLIPRRPPAGRPQAGYGRARAALTWARCISWALLPLGAASLAGYMYIYTQTKGRFCDATFTHRLRMLVPLWGWLVLVTAVLTVGLAVTRAVIARLAADGQARR